MTDFAGFSNGGLQYSDLDATFSSGLLPEDNRDFDARPRSSGGSSISSLEDLSRRRERDAEAAMETQRALEEQLRQSEQHAKLLQLEQEQLEQQRRYNAQLRAQYQQASTTNNSKSMKRATGPVREEFVARYDADDSAPSIVDRYSSKRRELMRVIGAALAMSLGHSLFWFSKKLFKHVVFTPERQATWTTSKSMAAYACMPLAFVVILWTFKVFFSSSYPKS
jgi:hypothetical protein